MNNMVEEQPEYPETDSPVKNVFLLPIFNRALPINWTIPYPIISEIHVSTQYSIEKYFVLLSQINSGVAAWSSILGSVWSHRASTTSHFKTLAYIQVIVRKGSLVSWLRLPGKGHVLMESTQERLSRHRILWSHQWPGLGLHAKMWTDGPCGGSPRL